MATSFPSFESRTLTVDGLSIHYFYGGSGSPLVLVHGLGSSAAVEFYFNLEPLAANHRVLAIDLPGFGRSDKPMLEYTIDLFVKVVRDLMVSEGLKRAAVMGVSLGGRVALGLAGPQLTGEPRAAKAGDQGEQLAVRLGLHRALSLTNGGA